MGTLKNYLFIKSDIKTEWHKSCDVKHNIPWSCTLCPRMFYSERNIILHAYAHSIDDTIGFESRHAISCTSSVTRDATSSTSGVNAEFCTTTNTMDDPMVPSDEEI